MKDKIKKFIKRWHRFFQLGFMILLFYLLFKRFQLDACLELLEQIHLPFLIMGIIALAAGLGLYGYAWYGVLKILGCPVKVGKTINVFFQSLFVNNFATFVGGDVFRAIKVYGDTKSKFDVGFSLFISRIVLLYSIIWIAGGASFLWGHFLHLGSWLRYLGAIIFVVSTFFLIGFQYLNFKREYSPQNWLGCFIQKIFKRLKIVQEHFSQFMLICVMNLLGHLCGFVVIWFFARGLDIPIDFLQVILFHSIARLVIILPITVNGLGLREMSFVGLLTRLGFQDIEAFSLGLLASLATVFVSIFGGLLLLKDSLQSKAEG